MSNLTQEQIVKSTNNYREEIKKQLGLLKLLLDGLKKLQAQCPHPDKHSDEREHDSIFYWCDDCGKTWSEK